MSTLEQFNCLNIESLSEAATKLLEKYPDSRVFAFDGEMGAGKTTFIKCICELLDVRDVVNSPTFAIVNVYKTVRDDNIFHLDLYRLKEIEEFFDIGYEDYFYSGSYCFIEWPGKVYDYLPDNTVHVKIKSDPETENRVIYY